MRCTFKVEPALALCLGTERLCVTSKESEAEISRLKWIKVPLAKLCKLMFFIFLVVIKLKLGPPKRLILPTATASKHETTMR